MLEFLIRLAGRHGPRVLWAALVAGILAAIVGAPISGLLVAGGFDDPRSDSSSARAQLSAAAGVDDRGVTALVSLGVVPRHVVDT